MSATKIVQQALNKQTTGVEMAFKEAIMGPVRDAIEAKRAEVGANLFGDINKNKNDSK